MTLHASAVADRNSHQDIAKQQNDPWKQQGEIRALMGNEGIGPYNAASGTPFRISFNLSNVMLKQRGQRFWR
jgi:hypothetical protein